MRVLGSAAGGGVPQWNCACANCGAARSGAQPRRSQSSFAVSAAGDRWWLVNVSPDVAAHIEAFPALQPRSARGTPIAGMLLTDANVDHMGGLAVTRQAGDHGFDIFSTATVRALAMQQRAFAAFGEPPHRWRAIAPDDAFSLGDGLHARVVPIGGATPGYDGRRPSPGAVVAYEIEDERSGARALFAPVFPEVAQPLLAAVAHADVAFLDGSFWSDDELSGLGVEKPARSLGHMPVGGEDGSLASLCGVPRRGRRFFAHLNNTNPLLDPASAAFHEVAHGGFELAEDGLELVL